MRNEQENFYPIDPDARSWLVSFLNKQPTSYYRSILFWDQKGGL